MSVRIRQRIQQRSGNNTEEYQMTDQRMIGFLIVSCCLTCWKRKQKQRRQRMTVNGNNRSGVNLWNKHEIEKLLRARPGRPCRE